MAVIRSSFGNTEPKRRAGKKALVVAPFFSTESVSNRPFAAAAVLSRVAAVDVVTTDFDHQTKSARVRHAPGDNQRYFYLDTPRYASNVGIARFFSHTMFALRAARFCFKRREDYDIVYVTLPLNLAACCIFLLCRNQLKIVDVIDIWPDVLPFSQNMKLLLYPLFSLWKQSFRFALRRADAVLTVSDFFYQESLKYFKKEAVAIKRFYIGHPVLERGEEASESALTIGYVGNIGRLYDFATLLEALSKPALKGKFQFYLIGDGDRREWLLRELRRRSIPHVYFGIVHDKKRLSRILARCDVGFNGYVNTTAAFSYKANTYLAAGLPLINSMGRDLHDLVRKHGIGFNYRGGDVHSLCACLYAMNRPDLRIMMRRSRQLFRSELEQGAIMDQMENFFTSLLKKRAGKIAGNAADPSPPSSRHPPGSTASFFGREPGNSFNLRLRD